MHQNPIDNYAELCKSDTFSVPEHWKAFFFQQEFSNNKEGYAYLLVDESAEDKLLTSIEQGVIPDFAVVLEAGAGTPDSMTKYRMERYYGFDIEKASEAMA